MCIKNHLEIERRFLVDARGDKPWREPAEVVSIEQHYLRTDEIEAKGDVLFFNDLVLTSLSKDELSLWKGHERWSVRLRMWNSQWILSAKSKQNKDTAIELEWDVEGPVAHAVLELGPFPSVQKTRYCWLGADRKIWEIDEFEGRLAGVVLAEIELGSSDEVVLEPEWLGHEITGLKSWSNSALASMLTRPDGLP
ncbi:MAG: hypothetical protein L7U25_06265 [Candidatus Poseidonia sp.]|nr:hypothetical protein [Poseidonia sp.]